MRQSWQCASTCDKNLRVQETFYWYENDNGLNTGASAYEVRYAAATHAIMRDYWRSMLCNVLIWRLLLHGQNLNGYAGQICSPNVLVVRELAYFLQLGLVWRGLGYSTLPSPSLLLFAVFLECLLLLINVVGPTKSPIQNGFLIAEDNIVLFTTGQPKSTASAQPALSLCIAF